MLKTISGFKVLEVKRGRPAIYSQDLADLVCERIANGQSMRTVCSSEDMPSISTVFKWIREKKDFSQQYARATEERTEAMSEEILDISDDSLEEAHSADPKAANAVVQAMRIRVDTRKWLMSKMKPKKYGDKLDMTTNGKDLPTPILGGTSLKNAILTNNNGEEDSLVEETA